MLQGQGVRPGVRGRASPERYKSCLQFRTLVASSARATEPTALAAMGGPPNGLVLRLVGLMALAGASETESAATSQSETASSAPMAGPSWSIPRCNAAKRAPRPKLNAQGIPEQPCGRNDLSRGDPCALLAPNPVMIPAAMTANAKLYPERRRGVLQSVAKGGHLVEVGTLNGQFAKFLLRSELKPASLAVMDISTKSCFSQTAKVARETGSNLHCLMGDSKKMLTKLNESAYDLIYVDGDHDYKGVCEDLESARTKVKPGGIMALNDYYRFEWQFLGERGRWGAYGVMHAANEFLVRYGKDWEVAYYTFGPTDSGGDLGLRRLR